jgi:hypothetical protein
MRKEDKHMAGASGDIGLSCFGLEEKKKKMHKQQQKKTRLNTEYIYLWRGSFNLGF